MSRRSVVLPRGLVGLRSPQTTDAESKPQIPEAEADEPRVRTALTAIDLKAVQRKAYERGYAHAISERGDAVDAALAALRSEAASLRAARAKDDEEIAQFAVRLACSIAEDVLGTTIDRQDYDVPAMVRRVLDAVMPDLDSDVVELHGHPDDLKVLPTTLRHGTTAVRRVPDPTVARGAFRVRGGDAEFYAGLMERLEAIRARLLQEVSDGAA